MIQWFTDVAEQAETGRKSAVRAVQAWQYLIAKASNKQLVRYGELAELMGYSNNRPLSYILGRIMDFCERNTIPPLTLIVVNADGIPGNGFTAEDSVAYNRTREEVFAFQWFKIIPPTVEEYMEGHHK